MSRCRSCSRPGRPTPVRCTALEPPGQ
ncbi:phage DNA packaging protein J [Streptomyces sp. NPDC023998]